MTHEEQHKVAEELLKAGDYAAAEATAREILAKESNDTITIAHAHNILSESLFRRGLFQEALPHAEQALSLAEQEQSKELQGKALNTIGLVYWNLSDNPKALECYAKALAIMEELGNKEGIAINLGNIGNVYNNLSDYPKALEYYVKALALDEELGGKSGIANKLGNIGVVYRNLLDYPKALEYYSKALALYEELGNKGGIAINLGNIGIVYGLLSDYPKALEYYASALALNEELGNKDGIARNLGNIGLMYLDIPDYSKALENLAKSLSLNEELGRKGGIARNLGNIGLVYADEKFDGFDFALTEEYLLKAIALLEEIGAKQDLYENQRNLAELYEKQKRWKKFAVHYKKYHEIYLEVQSEEATKQAQNMEHRRKIEEAERDRQLKIARHEVTMSLLHKTLPPSIAERLMDGEKNIADKFESVSILFADIVGFTPLSARTEPKRMVELLNNLFTRFDKLTIEHNVERIKTIGDAYMAVAGAPIAMEDHAQRVANFAIDVQLMMKDYRSRTQQDVHLRIGLHCGTVVAGVIGENKFSYDLWGDAVNTAARMESHGEAGKIHCSEEFAMHLQNRDDSFVLTERGEMEIKGKGIMKTYFLERAQ